MSYIPRAPSLLARIPPSLPMSAQNTAAGWCQPPFSNGSLTDIFALTPGLERLEISYGIREFEFTQYGLSAILDGMSLLVETLSNNLELLPKLVEFVFASWACGDPAFSLRMGILWRWLRDVSRYCRWRLFLALGARRGVSRSLRGTWVRLVSWFVDNVVVVLFTIARRCAVRRSRAALGWSKSRHAERRFRL
ncbi:hypothetical protein CPB85DRAFT_481550 [Mucidula mucida]|nr:hypothetical protein CPB85DRAFT_481550 [Mucidula mucida]